MKALNRIAALLMAVPGAFAVAYVVGTVGHQGGILQRIAEVIR